ncbi:MAG TPA: DUF6544 family protein [Anaerolineaceae bacterium]|nr:DUF6544 family protein [Anaerolineaceae bacterium]
MDLLTLLLIGVIGTLVIGLLGFAIPSALHKPFIQQEETIAPEIPADLPPEVRRWLEVSGLDKTPGGNLSAWGLGKMAGPNLPLFGRVWMPLRWLLFLQPGEAFVWRTQITWWRRRFISGGDTLYEGKGMFDMGANQLDGENLDASQFTLLWIYSLVLAPMQAFARPGLVWKEETQNAVTLQVPLAGSEEKSRDFTLEFDPASGFLSKLSTLRTTARKGNELPFFISISSTTREITDGDSTFKLPEGMELGWEDFIYQRIGFVGLANGVSDVEEEIARGIRV